MNAFTEKNGELHAEQVPLREIARHYGTPCFVYARAALEGAWRELDRAFGDAPHLVCYAVKANSNLGVLDILARCGAGFDIVSGGELARVLAVDAGAAARTIFSGVGKSADEMRAALEAGVLSINVESAQELERLQQVAAHMGVTAPVALRINPDVDARTHPYIATGLNQNKFGIAAADVREVYRRAADMPNLRVTGMACHIGSQLLELAPFTASVERVLQLARQLQDDGAVLEHLDLGGGLGVRYRDETPPAPAEYVAALLGVLRKQRMKVKVLIEPGRVVAAAAGVLLTRVEYLKRNQAKHFAVVDAAMNDLLRPALYGAWQEIRPVKTVGEAPEYTCDVVGPVCESADFLGAGRPLRAAPGDLLAVMTCGAYAAVMSSNYNTRPRAAEVVVDGARHFLTRRRESVESLFAGETVLPR
ncbi:MAG: diaminopimelate decarboxylase [Gammaproteobacteria bacterium]|nr:diaminopimelate decarboxylase [Gammaproteobacteria bacterium]MDD9799580.1 diaminopimelate decarboxylase [Gammaproteobacteria bacterium]MDD9870859.1 diaminopimelate decarboxylase [Gammaproteobacteria bacterium]